MNKFYVIQNPNTEEIEYIHAKDEPQALKQVKSGYSRVLGHYSTSDFLDREAYLKKFYNLYYKTQEKKK